VSPASEASPTEDNDGEPASEAGSWEPDECVVAALRKLLGKKGLDATGTFAQLEERLMDAVHAEPQHSSDTSMEEDGSSTKGEAASKKDEDGPSTNDEDDAASTMEEDGPSTKDEAAASKKEEEGKHMEERTCTEEGAPPLMPTPAPRAAVAHEAASAPTGRYAIDSPSTPRPWQLVPTRAHSWPLTGAAWALVEWQDRATVFTKATRAKQAWSSRRRALEAVRRQARAAASQAALSRKVASHRRRQRLYALATARERWSVAVAQDTVGLEHAAKRRRVAEAAAARSGFVGRELVRAWRRWRAKLLVEDARMIRLLAAAGAASKGRKRRGFAAFAAASSCADASESHDTIEDQCPSGSARVQSAESIESPLWL
jgi:hypothetical protein